MDNSQAQAQTAAAAAEPMFIAAKNDFVVDKSFFFWKYLFPVASTNFNNLNNDSLTSM